MNERELIQRLGLPDEIVGPGDGLRSEAWICFICGGTTTSADPIPCPAPCVRCGGIIFQTWRNPSAAPVDAAKPAKLPGGSAEPT